MSGVLGVGGGVVLLGAVEPDTAGRTWGMTDDPAELWFSEAIEVPEDGSFPGRRDSGREIPFSAAGI